MAILVRGRLCGDETITGLGSGGVFFFFTLRHTVQLLLIIIGQTGTRVITEDKDTSAAVSATYMVR